MTPSYDINLILLIHHMIVYHYHYINDYFKLSKIKKLNDLICKVLMETLGLRETCISTLSILRTLPNALNATEKLNDIPTS